MSADKDLISVQQARDLVEAAHRAQAELARFDQVGYGLEVFLEPGGLVLNVAADVGLEVLVSHQAGDFFRVSLCAGFQALRHDNAQLGFSANTG